MKKIIREGHNDTYVDVEELAVILEESGIEDFGAIVNLYWEKDYLAWTIYGANVFIDYNSISIEQNNKGFSEVHGSSIKKIRLLGDEYLHNVIVFLNNGAILDFNIDYRKYKISL